MCRWSSLPRRSSPQILHRLHCHGLCTVHNIHKYSLLSHLGAFPSTRTRTIRRRRRRGPMAVQLETFQSQRLLGTVNAKVSLSTGVLLFGGGEYFASLVKRPFTCHIYAAWLIFSKSKKSLSALTNREWRLVTKSDFFSHKAIEGCENVIDEHDE